MLVLIVVFATTSESLLLSAEDSLNIDGPVSKYKFLGVPFFD